MVSHYNYLFVTLLLYSVFNERLPPPSRQQHCQGLASSVLVGPSGLEPPTSCLSGTRSNLLSYEPLWLVSDFYLTWRNSKYLFTIHYYLLLRGLCPLICSFLTLQYTLFGFQ